MDEAMRIWRKRDFKTLVLARTSIAPGTQEGLCLTSRQAQGHLTLSR